MAEVLRSATHFSSPPRRELASDLINDGSGGLLSPSDNGVGGGEQEEERRGGETAVERKKERRRRGGRAEEEEQLSLLALLLTVFRKSLLGCNTEGIGDEDISSMEIGWPTNVRHVAHVTFDRFHGFLGLPVEFEPDVYRRAPSASATVFGVSAESMQCSYDARGNSVPTILLLMQQRLYAEGGLQAEGIFRINAENSQEEYVREQLNNGILPEGIDVHCLAGLVKAWFRELPSGLLDSLTPEQMMQCQTEEDCTRIARLLPPTEYFLLDWAINLMADVVEEEHLNKMNARNVATVFAPNMTQMADPLTALMYAVQVMNFLRMLILKTLKERLESTLEDAALSNADPSDENGHYSPQFHLQTCNEPAIDPVYVTKEPLLASIAWVHEEKAITDEPINISQTSDGNPPSEGAASHSINHLFVKNSASSDASSTDQELAADSSNALHKDYPTKMAVRSSSKNYRKGRKEKRHSTTRGSSQSEKSKRASIVSRINSKVDRVEAI